MGHACIGIAPANRGDALTKDGLSLKRIPPQGDGHLGMTEYIRDEPVAIDPRNCRRAEGKNAVVGRLEQQAMKLGLVAGEHEVQNLPAPVWQDLIAARMTCDHYKDPIRHLSFSYDVRMRWKFVGPRNKTV